jgi:hypothetical protein
MQHGQIRFTSQNCLAGFPDNAERLSNTCRMLSVYSQKHDYLQDASGKRKRNTMFFDMPIHITTNITGTKTMMAKLNPLSPEFSFKF